EGGLFRLNRTSGEWKEYTNNPSDPHSLTQNFVTSITFNSEGEMLVSTLRGLNVYNPIADNFERVGDDIINCVRTHRNDVIVATENRGLKILSPCILSVVNYSHDAGSSASLSTGAVNAILQQSNGRLWVGSVEGGLSIKEKNGFRHITKEKDGLCHNSVSALCEGPDGQMFVGTWGGGIDLLSTGAHPRVIYHLPPPTSFSADYIGALAYDESQELLWIGTSQDILTYNLAQNSYRQITEAPASGCLGAMIDSSGHLWMGCAEGIYTFNLKEIDSEGHVPAKLYTRQDGEHPLLIKKISCVIQESDSSFYIGSNGNGLFRAVCDDEGIMQFSVFTSQQGLSSDSVRGLCKDQDGNIWISTENGLNRLNPDKGLITSFFQEDGLASNRFHWNNACTGKDGVLYFGHEYGYSEIHPETRIFQPERIRLLLTAVSRQGRSIQRNPHPKILQLHERDRNIRLQFAALMANAGLNVSYQYKMEGFDDEWITLPRGQREAIYSNLPGGRYTFKVRAHERYGLEIDDLSLAVRVKPYFYHTPPFALLLMFLFCSAAYAYFIRRLRKLQRSRRELSQAVEERTRALRETNAILRHQNEELASRKFLLSSENMGEKEGEFAEKVLGILRRMYKDPDLDIEAFSREMGMSKTLLNSRMQETLGQPTAQFIRTFRLSVAKEMLESGRQMNISEIAYEVGFNDPKYFTRCFSKEFGITPSDLIKKV
ncbi:MAG: helix-turn-helix domain-containing protein, partial [Bacteroidales bacterium]|nr:helix-turn-helix domain-containing protein [Bacteroidales bacterium]